MFNKMITPTGGSGGISDTEEMNWSFTDIYQGGVDFLSYFVVPCSGYNSLKIKQTTPYSDSSREMAIYNGYDLSTATLIDTVCYTKNQIYTVDISACDYILIKRNNPGGGTGNQGTYQLCV